jgi:hypothetical protein
VDRCPDARRQDERRRAQQELAAIHVGDTCSWERQVPTMSAARTWRHDS